VQGQQVRPPNPSGVVQTKNTLRANTTATNALSSWLVGTKENSTPPVDLPKDDFLQLLAEFVLVVSCMAQLLQGLMSQVQSLN
jgi:hypothetical protein